ncbi:hypothetical protein AAG570_004094 [Ranatra chinensis]|uniref:PBZ-type domain-containing protein n=1 Tax=Ranatra chinensis TaxID=642074 RepID=A0ABD0YPK8_9HEMI
MSSSEVDSRVACKYGADCYQKNSLHHEKYKHPEKKKRSSEEACAKNASKLKIEVSNVPEEFKEEFNTSNLNDDVRSWLKKIYSFEMPEDFYSFFEFTKSLTKSCELPVLGLHLVGPYDLLMGHILRCTKAEAHMHYRYYYDPPEFQTILKVDSPPQLHFGYFRDDPNEMPAFVGSNDSEKDCTIKIVAGNIFGAVNTILDNQLKIANPFMKMKVKTIQTALQKWSSKHGFTLDTVTPAMRSRKGKVMTKTFHGAGLVVPYNKKTEVGYRELAENDATLKKILKEIVDTTRPGQRSPIWTKLQPVITFANIANDECDFGASLELGIDLFCFGNEIFHQTALHQLTTAYNLLGRNLYATIAQLHLANRKKSSDPSVLT